MMSGHLCLKWNNHSSAFLKSISNIQVKERFCDATIACQGKYFPVHRIILSTCSDYFDEIFERMQSPHPYIVFKDIDPSEMELLLNYMYQGEVNVVQEKLPSLIKAAEALKIKGLAVPDDLPSAKDSSGKKRSNSSQSESEPKRRLEQRNRSSSQDMDPQSEANKTQPRIKEEPLDASEYSDNLLNSYPEDSLGHEASTHLPCDSQSPVKLENAFSAFPIMDDSLNLKKEGDLSAENIFSEQGSSWSNFGNESMLQNISSTQKEPNVSAATEYDLDGSRLNINSPNWDKSSTNPSQLHSCSFCNYKSYNGTHVKRHIMFKHTGEKPFRCTICHRKFTLKEHLKIHMRIHTGEKPYKCSDCGSSFRHKISLIRHKEKNCFVLGN